LATSRLFLGSDSDCPIEQNLTCFGSCTNKLWYDCSEYMGGKGCLVSYCVPCTDPVYPFNAHDCPFAYSEKEDCPSFCIHQIEYHGNVLDEDLFEADVDEELS